MARIRIVDNTTSNILFETDESVSIGVTVNKKERAHITVNQKELSVYLRDLSRERADIDLGRAGYGLWVQMKI